MTPTYTLFQMLVAQLETPFLAGVSGLVAAFSSYARAPIQAALVLYVAIAGLMMAGGHGGSAHSVWARALKIAIIAWFATDATAYTSWVQNFFLTVLPGDLATAVVSGQSGAVAADAKAFDLVWEGAWRAGWIVWKTLGVMDIGERIVVVLFWFATLISVGLAFGIWMMSRIVLALYVIVGPLMIGLALFSVTRSIFTRWIGGMISGVLLQVGILILLTLTLKVEAALVAQIPATVGPNVYVGLNLLLAGIMVFLLCGILAFQMPGWASSLAGGMQLHGGALALIMLAQARGATAAISGTGSAINKGADALRSRIAKPAQRSLSYLRRRK